MSSALPLIVFGQVYFLGSGTNTPFITPNLTLTPFITPNLILTPNIYQHPIQPEPTRRLPRSDYTYIPGIGAYKVHSNAIVWNEARKNCNSEGGHLVIINSIAESQRISELARKVGSNSEWPNYFHIGAHNLFNRYEWVTINSEPLGVAGFNEWDGGQPDRGDNEACAGIHSVTGKLDDSSCFTALGFICELPNV